MFPRIFYNNFEKEVEYPSYRKKSIQQNRENSIYLSIAVLCTYIIIHAIWNYFDLSRDFKQERYFSNNLRFITIIALLNILYNYLYEYYSFLRKEFITQSIIIIISLALLFLSSINSYVISNNPKNNLTPILIGAIAVSTLFKFNLRESVLVFICGILFFGSLFFVWRNSEVNFALNFSGISNIYILAFIVNRRIVSGSFKYFKQLRLTESINITLKNALQQKDEVLAIVAHDLRGPISNIKYISDLLSDAETPEADKKKYIELINTSCVNADDIINDILSISKIKNTSENIEIVDINKLVTEVHQNFLTNNLNRNIKLSISNEYMYAQVYTEKFKRILTNLLSNALKFTPENKTIEINAFSEESNHIIEIVDEGIGITDETQLFKKYSEVSRKGLKGEESIGLGLYIVKELTEMMNGSISYKANEKGGSKFILRIPKA